MIKIALLSDVHGNITALEAVINDAHAENVTEFWLIGDLIMPGPGRSELFAMLKQLNLTVFVKGNWEDCFLEGIAGDIDLSHPTDVYIARLAQFQYEQLTSEEIAFIENLPLHVTRQINGLTIGISHNLPDKNYGPALITTASQAEMDRLTTKGEDIAIYGHIHHQLMRYSSQDQLIINPGSIGQPFVKWPGLRTDLRAQYALLTIDDNGLADVHFKKVAYDVLHEIELAKQAYLPYVELYRLLLETGKTYTHDEKKLAEINQHFDYVQDVVHFLSKKK